MIYSLFQNKRLATIAVIIFALIVVATIFIPLVSEAQQQQTVPRVSSCTGWTGFMPGCWIESIVAYVSATMIYIAAWILTVAGLLFNLLIDHTVINFATFFYDGGVKTAIETAWTAFRDISNILIIGMFVFIAISIILGADNFGNKRLVAQVLMIAVLINFSLLFTKIIIDFSNFTAYQFYTAASLQGGAGGSAGGSSGFGQKGIAGRFIQFIGVSGFGDSVDATRATAASNNSGIALLHGVMSAVFLIAAAAVLFYGSFLLASRAILLVFLLLTSSLAFASYLLPKSVVKNFGWEVWWGSLLKAALFAPLLMLFLWITLTVSAGMKANIGTLGTGGQPIPTLGAVLTDPTVQGGMEVLFMYFIVLGLLFVSFKVAASFSQGITGFDWAKVIPNALMATGFRSGGFLLKNAVGGSAHVAGDWLQDQSKKGNGRMSREFFNLAAKSFKSVAKADFNAMQTPLGSKIATQLSKNLPLKKDFMIGKPAKGYDGFAGDEKARGEATTKKAQQKFADSGLLPRKLENALKEGNKASLSETEAARVEKAREEAKIIRGETANAAAAGAAQATKNQNTGQISREEFQKAIAAMPQEKKEYDKETTEVRLAESDIAKMETNRKTQMQELGKSIRSLKEERKGLSVKANDQVTIQRKADIDKQIKEQNKELKRGLMESERAIKEAHKRADKARGNMSKIEKVVEKSTPAPQKKEKREKEKETDYNELIRAHLVKNNSSSFASGVNEVSRKSSKAFKEKIEIETEAKRRLDAEKEAKAPPKPAEDKKDDGHK